MATPQQLRENAWSKLQSARHLLAAGQFDEASYLAGYTVELVLKARYCTHAGWTDFPDTAAELRRLGAKQLVTHDLEELLTLAQHSVQPLAFSHIDWSRALNWEIDQRYAPRGGKSPEEVKAQIEETAKAFGEVIMLDTLQKLGSVERDVTAAVGPFSLFAVVTGISKPMPWAILAVAPWLKDEPGSRFTELVAPYVSAALDPDLLSRVDAYRCVSEGHPWVQAFHTMFSFRHSLIFAANNIVNGVAPPAGFVITSMPSA